MKIHIKSLAGTILTLQVDPSETIVSLQLRIFEAWGAPIEQQHLVFNGVPLSSEGGPRTVGEYNLHDGATINLMLRVAKPTRKVPPPVAKPGKEIDPPGSLLQFRPAQQSAKPDSDAGFTSFLEEQNAAMEMQMAAHDHIQQRVTSAEGDEESSDKKTKAKPQPAPPIKRKADESSQKGEAEETELQRKKRLAKENAMRRMKGQAAKFASMMEVELDDDDDEEKDGGRRFGGQGMLPNPPGLEGVVLRHVKREKTTQGEYEYPERNITEFKYKGTDEGQVLKHYVPDGGVYDPQRSPRQPVIMPAPHNARQAPQEPACIDTRKERKQMGLGDDGEVCDALKHWENIRKEEGGYVVAVQGYDSTYYHNVEAQKFYSAPIGRSKRFLWLFGCCLILVIIVVVIVVAVGMVGGNNDEPGPITTGSISTEAPSSTPAPTQDGGGIGIPIPGSIGGIGSTNTRPPEETEPPSLELPETATPTTFQTYTATLAETATSTTLQTYAATLSETEPPTFETVEVTETPSSSASTQTLQPTTQVLTQIFGETAEPAPVPVEGGAGFGNDPTTCSAEGDQLTCISPNVFAAGDNITYVTNTIQCDINDQITTDFQDAENCVCQSLFNQSIINTTDFRIRICACAVCPKGLAQAVSLDCSAVPEDPFVLGQCKTVDCDGRCDGGSIVVNALPPTENPSTNGGVDEPTSSTDFSLGWPGALLLVFSMLIVALLCATYYRCLSRRKRANDEHLIKKKEDALDETPGIPAKGQINQTLSDDNGYGQANLSSASELSEEESADLKVPIDDDSGRADAEATVPFIDPGERHRVDSTTEEASEVHERRNKALLGVSVDWLKNGLLQELLTAGFARTSTIYDLENLKDERHSFIRKKGERRLCPLDGRMGTAYVHCLDQESVGPANYMLSYSWGYPIGDIVDTLLDFCAVQNEDPKHTYVWICFLCINQWRVYENLKQGKKIEFTEFRTIFHNRVTTTGHLLAMMSPWHDPKYITRIWCIYEFYAAALRGENVKVSIVMPPREKQDMARTIGLKGVEGLEQVYKTLGSTHVENAIASQEEDRTNILKMVEQGPGFEALNTRVNDLLRQWVKESALGVVDLLKSSRKNSVTQRGLPDWGSNRVARDAPDGKEQEDGTCGVADKATTARQASFARLNLTRGISSSDGQSLGLRGFNLSDSQFADFLRNIGVFFHKNGEHQQALECQQIALNTYSSIGSNDGLAASHASIGSVLQSKGDLTGALSNFRKSLSVRESASDSGGDESTRTRERAASLNNIASVLLEQGDTVGALENSRKALSMLASSNCPEAAASHAVEGSVLFQQGDYKLALEQALLALSLREPILGLYHPDTASSYFSVGLVHHQMNNCNDALMFCQQALAIRVKLLGWDHPDTIASSQKVELLLWEINAEETETNMVEAGFGTGPTVLQAY